MIANARQGSSERPSDTQSLLPRISSPSVFICPSRLLRAVSLSNGVHLWLRIGRFP